MNARTPALVGATLVAVAACGAGAVPFIDAPSDPTSLRPDGADPRALAAATARAAPRLEHAPRRPGALELVLLGDTGAPSPFTADWRAAIAAEADKDAIVVLGDLVYPHVPPCPTGVPDSAAREVLDARVGATLADLGAPAYLALGNHDVSPLPGEPDRAACLIAWASERPDLVLPDRVYTVDFGVAVLAVIDTTALDSRAAAVVRAAFDGHPGWRILAGHHTLRTYHDHARQDVVRPWLVVHDLRPDVYLNGHAHVLQLGVYDGVVAITSGSATDPREHPRCPTECGPGQVFGSSVPGFALLRLEPNDTLAITFKDATGEVLWRWHTARRRVGTTPSLSPGALSR